MCKNNNESHNSCNHSHNHSLSHNHNHHHHSTSFKNIKIAFLLNFIFSLIEIVGGLLTNSSAILSDAIHDLGDSLSLGLALLFEKKSAKEPNDKFPYGYKRLSAISALINTIVLSLGTVFVFKESITRILNPQPVIAEGMLFLAIFGVIINGASVLKMKNGIKISEKAVMLHLLEDLFGWLAVLIVSIVVAFTDFYVLDPILSLIICFIMFRNIYYNTKTLYNLIMQGTPENINIKEIKEHLSKEYPIQKVSSLKIWSLDGESNIATISITIDKNIDTSNTNKIKQSIRNYFKDYNISDITIEISEN